MSDSASCIPVLYLHCVKERSTTLHARIWQKIQSYLLLSLPSYSPRPPQLTFLASPSLRWRRRGVKKSRNIITVTHLAHIYNELMEKQRRGRGEGQEGFRKCDKDQLDKKKKIPTPDTTPANQRTQGNKRKRYSNSSRSTNEMK